MSDAKTVTLTVELTKTEAYQLAQFCKRSGFSHYRECATSDEEAYTMVDAIGVIRRALAEKGYSPR